ncbi:TrkH family potassium uptake protein, partial [Escherichia coli]
SERYASSHFSSIQVIVFYYLIMTIVSLGLFYIPFFREPDSHVPFIDMLFMAISTISVTGLSTFDINSAFNDNGVILLEILFQVGGLGIMMISTAFIIFSKRRITLRQRQLIMTDMNQPRLSGIVRLIRITFVILLWFQVLFGAFFSIY